MYTYIPEKEMAPHSSTLAWKIPRTEKPGGMQSTGLQRIGHEKQLSMHACIRGQWLQPCPTFCDTMDCSPPGSSVRGILQARILEWVAISSSRGSS